MQWHQTPLHGPHHRTSVIFCYQQRLTLLLHLLVQSDGQQLPLKQLARQVRQHWAAAAAEHGSPPDATSMKAILRVKLERIAGVELQGKQVVLSA